MVKVEFIELQSGESLKKDCIIKSMRRIFDNWASLTSDLVKIALVDGFVKRYLRGYVAAAIVIMGFERMLD